MSDRLLDRPLALAFLARLGSMTSFYLLLPVVPLYAVSSGSAGQAGAGLATGALMLATVCAEPAVPALAGRLGDRRTLAAGTALLGAPVLLLPLASGLPALLAVCLVRGLGFAIVVTVGGALVAMLVPPSRRGEGLGLYGVVAGVPKVVALPLGVWLAESVGYTPVFVAGALASLAGLAAVPGIPVQRVDEPDGGRPRLRDVAGGFRSPALARPAIVFASTALAGGIVVTFLPLVTPAGSGSLVAAALLANCVAATAARWWAGRRADSHGAGGLLAPALLLAAAGTAVLALAGPICVLTGAVVFGAGFGIVQTASLTHMYAQAPRSSFGVVSAVWNAAYDGGYCMGASAFGLLSALAGAPAAFLTAALLMVTALPLAVGLRGPAAPSGAPRPH